MYKIVKPYKENRWGYYNSIYEIQNQEGEKVFSCDVSEIATCAWSEFTGFSFGIPVAYSKELQKIFVLYLKKIFRAEGNGSFGLLNLNMYRTKGTPNQPAWFIECLDNHPNLLWKGNWRVNKAHERRDTKVKPYVIAL